MKVGYLILLLFPLVANAAGLDKEARIRTQVQLKVTLVQANYCSKELGKLQSTTATPFMLNQKDPADANKRFSQNRLTLEEEIAYNEFSTYCAGVFANLKTLTSELQASN